MKDPLKNDSVRKTIEILQRIVHHDDVWVWRRFGDQDGMKIWVSLDLTDDVVDLNFDQFSWLINNGYRDLAEKIGQIGARIAKAIEQ